MRVPVRPFIPVTLAGAALLALAGGARGLASADASLW